MLPCLINKAAEGWLKGVLRGFSYGSHDLQTNDALVIHLHCSHGRWNAQHRQSSVGKAAESPEQTAALIWKLSILSA